MDFVTSAASSIKSLHLATTPAEVAAHPGGRHLAVVRCPAGPHRMVIIPFLAGSLHGSQVWVFSSPFLPLALGFASRPSDLLEVKPLVPNFDSTGNSSKTLSWHRRSCAMPALPARPDGGAATPLYVRFGRGGDDGEESGTRSRYLLAATLAFGVRARIVVPCWLGLFDRCRL